MPTPDGGCTQPHGHHMHTRRIAPTCWQDTSPSDLPLAMHALAIAGLTKPRPQPAPPPKTSGPFTRTSSFSDALRQSCPVFATDDLTRSFSAVSPRRLGRLSLAEALITMTTGITAQVVRQGSLGGPAALPQGIAAATPSYTAELERTRLLVRGHRGRQRRATADACTLSTPNVSSPDRPQHIPPAAAPCARQARQSGTHGNEAPFMIPLQRSAEALVAATPQPSDPQAPAQPVRPATQQQSKAQRSSRPPAQLKRRCSSIGHQAAEASGGGQSSAPQAGRSGQAVEQPGIRRSQSKRSCSGNGQRTSGGGGRRRRRQEGKKQRPVKKEASTQSLGKQTSGGRKAPAADQAPPVAKQVSGRFTNIKVRCRSLLCWLVSPGLMRLLTCAISIIVIMSAVQNLFAQPV